MSPSDCTWMHVHWQRWVCQSSPQETAESTAVSQRMQPSQHAMQTRERARETAERHKRRILLRAMCCRQPRCWKLRRRASPDSKPSARPWQQSGRRRSRAPANSPSQHCRASAAPCTHCPMYHSHPPCVSGRKSSVRSAHYTFVLIAWLSMPIAESPLHVCNQADLQISRETDPAQYAMHEHTSWLSHVDPALHLTHEMSDEQQPIGAVSPTKRKLPLARQVRLTPRIEAEKHETDGGARASSAVGAARPTSQTAERPPTRPRTTATSLAASSRANPGPPTRPPVGESQREPLIPSKREVTAPSAAGSTPPQRANRTALPKTEAVKSDAESEPMPDDDLPSLEFEMDSGRCIRAQERRYQQPHERRARSAMVSVREGRGQWRTTISLHGGGSKSGRKPSFTQVE